MNKCMENFKLTTQAEGVKNKLANDEELDFSQFGGSDGFWYDITDGGYFKPEEALSDKEQIKKVNEAVELLKQLKSEVYDNLTPEF